MKRLVGVIGVAWCIQLGASADTGLDGVSRAQLHRGWHLLETGSAEKAVEVFESFLVQHSSRPRAIIGLARAYEKLKRFQEAENAWRRLPTDPVAMEGLATLLLDSRPEEAVALARRLQALRLEDAEPHLLESRAALSAGLLEEAVQAAQRYAGWPGQSELSDAGAETYLALAGALAEEGRSMEGLSWVQRCLEEGQHRATVERARVMLRDIRGVEALALASEAEMQDAELYGNRGEEQLAAGDVRGAETSWRIAGALDGENPRWPARLGKLLAEHHSARRREAALEYERALDLQNQLDALVPAPVEPLPVVEVEVPEPEQWPLWPLGVGLLGVVLGWVAWSSKARSREVGLRTLIEKAPEASGEVLTVLHALQHDVIKHNTSVLPALADALEAGERDLALDVASRVLGRDGGRGVLERWNQGMERIEVLGHRHGLRVSLRRADSVLGPMCRAMEELGKEARQLHRLGGVSPSRIRQISEALNETGAPELAALIGELGVCVVTSEIVERVFEAVRSEPSMGTGCCPQLRIQGLTVPVSVRIVQRDLDIILSNLLRNALEAVREQGEEGRVGVSVESRLDPVTGLEEVVIQVVDTALMELGEEDIARQPSNRGIGIVREVLARHGGVLRIEEATGWSKAMAIHLAGGGA